MHNKRADDAHVQVEIEHETIRLLLHYIAFGRCVNTIELYIGRSDPDCAVNIVYE